MASGTQDKFVGSLGTFETQLVKEFSDGSYGERIGVTLLGGAGDEIAALPVENVLPTSIIHGEKLVTTAGTAVALASTTTLVTGLVQIIARAGNVGLVYIGGSGVTAANGYPLSAEDELAVVVSDPSTLYVNAANNGDGVRYIAS